MIDRQYITIQDDNQSMERKYKSMTSYSVCVRACVRARMCVCVLITLPFCTLRMHLFDQKYNKNMNIVKCYYN